PASLLAGAPPSWPGSCAAEACVNGPGACRRAHPVLSSARHPFLGSGPRCGGSAADSAGPKARIPPMTCWYCGSDLPSGVQYCHVCGHSQTERGSSPLYGVVDAVTGIWNQKFVEALLGQEANRAVRYRRPLSVLVVELDHAEHIHNELGQ